MAKYASKLVSCLCVALSGRCGSLSALCVALFRGDPSIRWRRTAIFGQCYSRYQKISAAHNADRPLHGQISASHNADSRTNARNQRPPAHQYDAREHRSISCAACSRVCANAACADLIRVGLVPHCRMQGSSPGRDASDAMLRSTRSGIPRAARHAQRSWPRPRVGPGPCRGT